MIKKLIEVALYALLAAASGGANAGLMTLDFNEIPSDAAAAANFEYRGFRFSPEFHYHVFYGGVYTDGWGFYGMNANYLGPDPDNYECNFIPDNSCTGLYMDHGGRPFSLLSLIGPLGIHHEVSVISSKGGRVDLTGAAQLYEFSGSDWVGIKWIMFLVSDYIMPAGVDDIKVFATPEPGTIALLGLSLAGLAAARRRKQ